jgi:hypothetical protein
MKTGWGQELLVLVRAVLVGLLLVGLLLVVGLLLSELVVLAAWEGLAVELFE